MQFSQPIRITGLDFSEESAPIYDKWTNQLFFVRTFLEKNPNSTLFDQVIWYGSFKPPYNSLENTFQLDFSNKKENRVVCGMSADGKRVYCFHPKDMKRYQAGLYVYDRIENKLKNPKKIEIPGILIQSNKIGFFMHEDEKTLLISYKGENSIGEEDLYRSNFEDKKWTTPIPIGAEINTTGFEISPFLTRNKDTLFFATNGRTDSYGGCDIYYSCLSKSGEWTTPVNLGPTINTVHFEAYLFQVENGLLWSSNKNGNYTDFYISQLVPSEPLQIQYTKKDVSTFQGFDGEIALKIQSGNPPYKYQWSTGGNSNDLFQLRAGEYSVQVTDSKEQKIQLRIQITQPQLPLDSVFHFPEIQYKSDTWEFVNDSTCSSYDSLNQIINTLNQYPSIVLKLISHTDARGDKNRNLVLSQNRSRACYRYLVLEKGIDPRRIIPLGLGESSPASYLDPSTGKEVLLSAEYLSRFDDNSLVISRLNQLNRRTEGIIDRMNFSNNDPKAPESYLLFLKLP
jgi:outer membrane protein OmpA-like peptidoglycan-associated protein